jgi:hypothetical protein
VGLDLDLLEAGDLPAQIRDAEAALLALLLALEMNDLRIDQDEFVGRIRLQMRTKPGR